MADNPAGWSAHLDASCNYIANTAVNANFFFFKSVVTLCGNIFQHSNPQDANWPTYVGEFSLAVTECQKYLNGGFHTPYVPPDVRDLLFDENADDRVMRKLNIRPVSLLVLITTATGTASLMSTSIS